MAELRRVEVIRDIYKGLPGVQSTAKIREIAASEGTGQIGFWDGNDLLLNATFGSGAAFLVDVTRRSLIDSGSRCPTYRVTGFEEL
jgi:hypothetical protein